MHPISPEAKKELIEALKNSKGKVGFDDSFESGNEFGIDSSISIVESFPTSSEGLGTSEPENHGNQDASLTCNQDASLSWIPVTERLPNEGEWVVAIDEKTRAKKLAQFSDIKNGYLFHDWGISSFNATKWISLPPVT